MSRRATKRFSGVGLALALVFLSAGALEAQAQRGAITGVVQDATTSQPLQSAQIQVVGENIGALTNSAGRYRIENVPAGQVEVRAVLIGYAESVQTVDVVAGESAVQNFSLDPQAVALDQIVVTATGEQRARQVANQVSNIDANEITATNTVTSVSDLITGRSAGVSVLSSSGTTGAGTRIRIRGSSSISLQNDPVIYIDGVRIESSEESSSIGVGGQVPNRLGDLNPEDIESIEIVKGPSAATLYGTDAANGVIRITTKRGQFGTAAFTVWSEFGAVEDNNDYPDNWAALDDAGDLCLAVDVADALCSISETQRANPLEADISTPFSTGYRQQHGVSVSGGSEALNYYVSGEWESEDGVYDLPGFERERLQEQLGEAYADLPESQFNPNSLERLSLRANFGGSIRDDLSFQVRSGYISSDLQLPQNDNNVLGIVPSGILGFSTDDEASQFGYGFFLPADVFALSVAQEVERFTGSFQLDWEPLSWLSGRMVTGIDAVNRTDVQNVPPNRVFFGATLPTGVRDVNHARIFNYTVDANASARFRLNDLWTSRTTVGTQYFREHFTRSDAHGELIVGGAESIAAAAITEAFEQTAESITLGAFVEQEFGFRDNLFITAAVRGDDNSAFGQDFDFIVYPKVGASWVVTDEEWFPRRDFLTSLRLRGAWGRSGAQPGPTDALRFFTPVAVTADQQDVGGVTFGELGNPDLEPEQSEEIEVGFDLGMFEERLGLELTYYTKTTTDLLIEQPLPPSGGVGDDRFVNLGEVSNQGWEAVLTADPVRNPTVQWNLALQGSINKNELQDLGTLPNGDPIPPIIEDQQRFIEGYPLGGYWGRQVSFEDANNDGIIAFDEVSVEEEASFIDEALPTREASLSTSVTLWNQFRLNGLLDYQGGHSLYNSTEEFRCGFFICEGLFNPDAPLDHQARAVASALFPASQSTVAGFIEDASFVKLREVGLTWFVPEQWSNLVGAERSSITLSGRNLATWTDYTGLDPELNQFGQSNFLAREFLTQPPVRRWTIRVNANF